MGAAVLDALVEQTGISAAQAGLIDDVIVGCVSQSGGQAGNVGRNMILSSRLIPEHVPGTAVDRQCGSSQQAIHFAAQAVMSGTQDVVIAAGVEHMSSVPIGSNVADAYKAGHGLPMDQVGGGSGRRAGGEGGGGAAREEENQGNVGTRNERERERERVKYALCPTVDHCRNHHFSPLPPPLPPSSPFLHTPRKNIKTKYGPALAARGIKMFSQFEGAEILAEKYDLTRAEMEDFALASHQKAAAATDAGHFKVRWWWGGGRGRTLTNRYHILFLPTYHILLPTHVESREIPLQISTYLHTGSCIR
jgi:hypothetical protein